MGKTAWQKFEFAWLLSLIGGLILTGTTALAGKQGPTYYTPERVAVGRQNLEEYAWAQDLFERIKEGDGFWYYIGPEYGPAEIYAEQSDEFMWMLQPTTRIARAMEHEARAICPVHGTEVRQLDPWCPYRIDPINKPYKIQCMLGGEWYPSNDYAAGDMTSGDFADDGDGCHYQGRTYYFLREYAHMAYGSAVIPALRSLSQAYVLTGDARYARKGAILLARLASEYPNHEDRQDRLHYALYGGRDPHYRWKTGGMITDLIWETFNLEAAVYAYDGLYSYMEQDAEMLTFLRAQGLPFDDAGDLRRYIEHYLVRAGMIGLLNGAIEGNEGHHQAAALACALVLDDYSDAHPNSVDMVEYAFHGAGHAAYLLTNGLTRDGGGHESPGYNEIKLDFIRVNQAMEAIRRRRPDRFPLARYPDLFAGEKARRLFDSFLDLTVLDRFQPSIGDAGGIGPARRTTTRQYSQLGKENLYAFGRYGDARFARAALQADDTFFPGELFEPYPAAELTAALQRPAAQIERTSRLLDGYGLAILESGTAGHRRAAVLNYSSLIGHRQCDQLSLQVYARELNFLPDLGYPKSWDYRWQWDANSLAHNTVTVDETQPHQGFGGLARLFASAGGLHIISAGHDPYPAARTEPARPGAAPTQLYERTVLLVDVDDEQFYIVDLFAVDGGEQHDQSWHALLEDVQSPALEWQMQEGGTLAGPQVEQFGQWVDRWGRARDDFPSYVADVGTTLLARPAAWTWKTELPEGDGLRLHIVPVGGDLEVLAGRGRSPARPEHWGLDYIVARRQVQEGAASVFLSVLDVFQGEAVVHGVRLVGESPLVLEVERAGAVDRIQLQVPLTPSTTTAQRPLGVRLHTVVDGETVRDVRIGQWDPVAGGGYLHGEIAAVDYVGHRIELAYDAGWAVALQPGCAVRIYNEARSALYRVVDVVREGERLLIGLDATALLAQGPVAAVEEGQVRIDAFLTFAIQRPLADDELVPVPDYYAGSWLGEAEQAVQVRGAVQQYAGAEHNTVFLRDLVSAEKLEETFGGRVVSIWQYGIGDRVEVVLIEQ